MATVTPIGKQSSYFDMLGLESDRKVPDSVVRKEKIELIKKMISKYDKDGSGTLDVREIIGAKGILKMHDELLNVDQDKSRWGWTILGLFVFLILSITSNFGVAYVANQLLKEVKYSGGSNMVSTTDGNTVIGTRSSTVNVPLSLLPLVGIKVVDQLQHLQFSALGVTITNGPMAGYYNTLKCGMKVKSYQYIDETNMNIIGSGSERLKISNGHVSASGFFGMDPGSVIDVCPGLGDSSHARCSMLYLSDVDINAIMARAAQLGLISSSRRLQLGSRAPSKRPTTSAPILSNPPTVVCPTV